MFQRILAIHSPRHLREQKEQALLLQEAPAQRSKQQLSRPLHGTRFRFSFFRVLFRVFTRTRRPLGAIRMPELWTVSTANSARTMSISTLIANGYLLVRRFRTPRSIRPRRLLQKTWFPRFVNQQNNLAT